MECYATHLGLWEEGKSNHFNFALTIYNYLKGEFKQCLKTVLTKFKCNHKPSSAIPCNDIAACS